MRPIQATIDPSALNHNLSVVKAKAQQSKVLAVVKANGYGHGLLNVAKGLAAADAFAVLGLNEALALREAGYKQDILLLEGVFSVDELLLVSQHNISIVVHCDAQIVMLENSDIPVFSVHLKMNTGMNRLGFRPEAFELALTRLAQCPQVKSITLMTHFATADEVQGISEPFALFNQVTQDMTYPKSVANSAAILRFSETHLDWVRPGIMLYGATPIAGQAASGFGLRAVMQFTSQVIAIQALEAGESIGYGQCFTADKKMRIGIVACGYADGYPRHAPNGTPIAVDGFMTQTLGRVSMDMLFVDLSDLPDATIGSSVELWGNQVPVDAVAESAGTIGYELLCAIAPRVPMRVVG
jgi:alanine racemase